MRNKIKTYIIILSALLLTSSCTQAQDTYGSFRIMFYNVENLFDTKDNPDKNDNDFLPQGNQYWNNYRYWKKLNAVSQVIDSLGNGYPPALIGLCEVENDSVLFDLTQRSSLRKHKYEYIISTSDDPRGINVGLLYQSDEIKLIATKEYTPAFVDIPQLPTRNILHVTGQIVNGEILDIFVCHFKSRGGGIKKTQPYRLQTAKLLKQKADSVMSVRKRPNIIIMGDFNDYPYDESMRHVLDARSKNSGIEEKQLYNMFLHEANDKDKGSYRYRGRWIFPDQFIVNGNLLKQKAKTRISNNEAYVYSAGFLLEDDTKNGGKKPFRTYIGYKYLGGYSDHLPIYMDLEIHE